MQVCSAALHSSCLVGVGVLLQNEVSIWAKKHPFQLDTDLRSSPGLQVSGQGTKAQKG